MLSHRIGGIVIFVLLFCIGCGDSGIFHKTIDVGIMAVDIVSISEDRPAEVLFLVAGLMGDGCDPSIQKVSAERVGNTIFLRATGSEEIFDSGGYDCEDAVTATGGEVVVKDLEVGEYKVATGVHELLHLRIEKEAAYVIRKAGIGDITVQVKTSEGIVIDAIEHTYRASYFVRKAGIEDITVQLKTFGSPEGIVIESPYVEVYTAELVNISMGVEGYGITRVCGSSQVRDYPHKVVIDKGSSGIINVEIFGEVPINNDCIRYQHLDTAAYQIAFLPSSVFEEGIDLGTFGVGNYRVNINGYERVRFSIRPHTFLEEILID